MARNGNFFSVFVADSNAEMHEYDSCTTRTPRSGSVCITVTTSQILSNSTKETSDIHSSLRQVSKGFRLYQAGFACWMIAAMNTTYLKGSLNFILSIINFYKLFPIGFKRWVHLALVILSVIRESVAPDESGVGLAPSILRSSNSLDVTAETNPNITRRNKISHGINWAPDYLMTSDPDPELSNCPKHFAVEYSRHFIKKITNLAPGYELTSWHFSSRIVSNIPKESSDVHSSLHQGSQDSLYQACFACLMFDAANITYLEGSLGLKIWTVNYYEPFPIGFQHLIHVVWVILSIIGDSYFAYVKSGVGLAPPILRSSIPLDVTAETNMDIHKLPKISHGGNYWASVVGYSSKLHIRTIKLPKIEGRNLSIKPFALKLWEIQGVKSDDPAEHAPDFSLGTNTNNTSTQSIIGGAAPPSTTIVNYG